MLISKKWLTKFVPDLDHVASEVIASELTRSLAEVERFWTVGEELTKLVVGKVNKVEVHPNADKLHVCQVDIGGTETQIVCGAPNVAAGQIVVVCLPGGSVVGSKPSEKIDIGIAKLRGVESNGMLCSERELGISDDHSGILVLPTNFQVGMEFDDLLQDTIFEIENKSLTHRGDCFSHLGIAREIAARLDLPFQAPNYLNNVAQTETLPLEISLESEKCTRFVAVSVTNLKAQTSPFWLRLALARIGVRPVNHLVDVTNYLMFETGQPMHAYDYEMIKKHKLIVREARSGEKFTALDHKTYELAEGDLLITDSKQILGLAGIMGGLNSEVSVETTSIVLEAASFDRASILRTSRRLGLQTEASTRFSKTIDEDNIPNLLRHAVELLAEEQQLDVASEILDIYPNPLTLRELTVDLHDVTKLIGEEIEIHKILHYLELLGIEIKNRNSLQTLSPMTTAKPITIVIPSWRRDLQIWEDIAEEVARLFGYENIQPRLPLRESRGQTLPVISQLRRKVSGKLMQLGYSEVINYSFISKQLAEQFKLNKAELLEVTNAISPELNYFRNSLLPGLTNTLLKNQESTNSTRYFEIGRIIDNTKRTSEKLPVQPRCAGLVELSEVNDNSEALESFLHFKGEIEALLWGLGVENTTYEWKEMLTPEVTLPTNAALASEKTSLLYINNEICGVVSEIKPEIALALSGKIDFRIHVAELNLDQLIESGKIGEHHYQNFSIYPTVTRDLSAFISPKQPISTILMLLRKTSFDTPETVNLKFDLVDEFRSLKPAKRSVTIRVQIEPQKRTLTDQEANHILSLITELLSKSFKLEIR